LSQDSELLGFDLVLEMSGPGLKEQLCCFGIENLFLVL